MLNLNIYISYYYFIVCKEGDIEKLKYLLTINHLNINARDMNGYTALHYAIQQPSIFHSIEIINLLIKYKGININKRDIIHGHTCLHLACIINSLETVELLLTYNAKPYYLDKKNMLPSDHCKIVSITFIIYQKYMHFIYYIFYMLFII